MTSQFDPDRTLGPDGLVRLPTIQSRPTVDLRADTLHATDVFDALVRHKSFGDYWSDALISQGPLGATKSLYQRVEHR